MDQKKFNFFNRIIAVVMLVVSATVYLMTMEPTASFWDCGEFIASSYKLEVGHPPGNPVFQLIARVFTIFASPATAAMAVNAMSALCSAFTIFFLYLTIIHLARRIVKPSENARYSVAQAIAMWGAGVVGALAYCFSDTFWFSAVEAEVYAMSSMFTAIVFWAMFKWYDQADEPYANRWIVLISLLMGLSIGVHLLNLLTIPSLAFIYVYRKRKSITFRQGVMYLLASGLILAVVLYGIIPYLPKLAAYFDLLFVNTFSLPFNTGAIFFMVALFVLCFWGLFFTLRRGKVFVNTVLLCFTSIVTGFSLFSIVVIRSQANTPTNEYQPDNPFTLIRYLGREQYGSNPLVYGEYFDSPIVDIESGSYYTPLDGKYYKCKTPINYVYDSQSKMLFPRMWSPDQNHKAVYLSYMGNRGTVIPGAASKKPTFADNMKFFFSYQLNWMYWRYFMWNFAGRQNDLHGELPGNPYAGNWESGIGFIDRLRVGDDTEGPDYIVNSESKNHYYMLPLLLGLIGLFYQFSKDKRGTWVTFLLFFLTGIAIVIYLNQPPLQVRERDYAYAGSFYAFAIWIGLGVLALYELFAKHTKSQVPGAVAAFAVSMVVPVLMGCENWDDHDRSNRRTAVEMASNLLNSVGPDGILITHGDNDTFPLWYAQEVEEIRNDVRIVNTSLLGTDWYIDQMRAKINNSSPIKLTTPRANYLYGVNDFVYIKDDRKVAVRAKDVIAAFNHPGIKTQSYDGSMVSYIASRTITVPVNKENAIKYGIVDEKYADYIVDELVLNISKDKNLLSKQELIILDMLSNYQWDRPIHMLMLGGDIKIGLNKYLEYNGFTHKLVPIESKTTLAENGFADADNLYDLVKNKYSWDALKDDYHVDYQNLYTFSGVIPQRKLFTTIAYEQLYVGHNERAEELIDMAQECVPADKYPLDLVYMRTSNEASVYEMIDIYYRVGAVDKAEKLAREFTDALMESLRLFLNNYNMPMSEMLARNALEYYSYVIELASTNGSKELADSLKKNFDELLQL